MGLSFAQDEFISEKVCWVATLTDGTSVYQDDNRPDEAEPCAWLRLAAYVKEKQKEGEAFGVEKLEIKFWDHVELAAPAGAAAYYWINGVEAFAGAARPYYKYVVGYVLGGEAEMFVNKWLVPEIIQTEHEKRPVPYGDNLLISKRGEALGERKV